MNVENPSPPSPHALFRHVECDFDLGRGPHIRTSNGCLVSHGLPSILSADADTSMTGSSPLIAVFIFPAAVSLDNRLTQCRSLSSFCPTAGDGTDRASRVLNAPHYPPPPTPSSLRADAEHSPLQSLSALERHTIRKGRGFASDLGKVHTKPVFFLMSYLVQR